MLINKRSFNYVQTWSKLFVASYQIREYGSKTIVSDLKEKSKVVSK